MRLALSLLLALLLGCHAPAPKPADPRRAGPEVKEHLARADSARREGQLDAALREYRFVRESAPDTDASRSAETAIVEIEVSTISRSDHLPLPQPEANLPSGGEGVPLTQLQIVNRTAARLHVFLKGPQVSLVEVPSEGSAELRVLPGPYEVAIRGDDPSALPLFGRHVYDVGRRHRLALGNSDAPR